MCVSSEGRPSYAEKKNARTYIEALLCSEFFHQKDRRNPEFHTHVRD